VFFAEEVHAGDLTNLTFTLIQRMRASTFRGVEHTRLLTIRTM